MLPTPRPAHLCQASLPPTPLSRSFFDCKDTKKNSICKNNFGFSSEDAKTLTRARKWDFVTGLFSGLHNIISYITLYIPFMLSLIKVSLVGNI